ncbi:MAG: hypothetical protein IJX88_00370 [Clostridia bacterium]|nr:hypothetical protein [Clostridia bacterium]
MSNTNTKPAELELVEDEVVAIEEVETANETEAPAPKKKNVATRIFSAILAAISVAIFFLPIKIVKGFAAENGSLLNAIKDLFGKGSTAKIFGALPSYTIAGDTVSLLAGLVLYAFLAALVVALIFAIIGIFSGKTCCLRTAAYFFTAGFGAYAACTYAVTAYKGKGGVLDIICLGIAAFGAILYLVLAFAKVGKKAVMNLVQFILSAVFAAAILLTFIKCKNDFVAGVDALKVSAISFKLVAAALTAFLVLNLFIASIRLQTKKGLALDMVRYIIQIVLGAFVCVLAIMSKASEKTFLILAIAAVAVSLLQIILCCAQKGKKAVPVEEEEVEEEETVEYTVEEYAEAVTYEGGPVEGVEVAEEVTPTFTQEEQQEMPVQPAGYDFYNTKSFDPFIATLDNNERSQFTELFILKFKGVMPEIPEYVVGGDNKEFFRKIFIYLGQYRDRIPDGLLAKIYQFAIKF